MIKVKNLKYEYPDKQVLNNLTFEVKEGAITALVGHNGAGKTTLLQCLAGLRTPFSGDIFINGTNIIHNPRICNNIIGYLPTFYGLYDNLSVEQNLNYFALSHNIDTVKAKLYANEICEKLLLSAYKKTKTGQLSRGVRQRLVLAQILIHKPRLLLLEKPSTGLDYDSRNALKDYLTEINKRGVTALIATHNPDELELLATDVLVLENGNIIEHCKTQKLQTAHRLTLKLLETDESNINIVKKITGVDNVSIHNKTLNLIVDANDNKMAEILKKIIGENVPVVDFRTESILNYNNFC